MKRLLRVPVLLALAGCATTSSTTSGEPASETAGKDAAASAPQKLAITNVIPFDIAACGPRELTLKPATVEVVTGAILSMGPATQECFIDLTHRDGQPFDLKAKVTVAESGTTVEVNGLGASPEGKTCVENALKKLAFEPLPAGSKPVVAEVPVGAGGLMVKFGENPANDIAGRLRLAQPSLCECYASLGDAPPPAIKAAIEVGADKMVKATLPEGEPLAACLKGKLEAVNPGDASARLTWPLLLKNSYAKAVDPAAPAALRFQQLDGMRQQRTADTLIAAGQRVTAALAYDAAAQAYKKKPNTKLLPELTAKCNAVAEGDDKQKAALDGLVRVLEDSKALVVAEKSSDPQWAQVEPQLDKQLESVKAEITRVETQKQNDLKACPKVKY